MFRVETRGDVLLAVIDMPGRAMNVFSWALMDQLEALLGRIAADDAIRASVLTSGKSTFLAGADLEMVRQFTRMAATSTRAEMHRTCGRLGRLFNALEAQTKPMVAAINGLAFGGGLELAMACHHRVCVDDARAELALPEIKLGLMAAAGGTQRAPRLVGIEKGIEMLLTGRSARPREALSIGLVDELAAPTELVGRACEIAGAMAGKPAPRRLRQRLGPGPFDLAAADAAPQIARHFRVPEEAIARYPAYLAAIRSTIEGADLPMDEGGANEMDRFVDLMMDPVAGNMVMTLFINRQRADKLLANIRAPGDMRFAVTASGAAANVLVAALAATRAKVAPADATGPGDTIIGPADSPVLPDLRLVAFASEVLAEGEAGVAIASSPEYGRAIEIIDAGADAARIGKAFALARQLRATPYLHKGRRSLLATLAPLSAANPRMADAMSSMIEAANRLRADGEVDDTEAADVAVVVGGLFPAWAGGPFAANSDRSGAPGGHGAKTRVLSDASPLPPKTS